MNSGRGYDTSSTRLWRFHFAFGVVLVAVYFLFPLPLVARVLVYDWFCVSAAGAVVYGIRRYRPAAPGVWWLLAAGFATLAAGDLTWAYYEVVRDILAPFPSVADALYLAAYPLIAAALVGLSHHRGRGSDRGRMIDGAIIAVSFGVAAWYFFLEPYLRDPAYPLFERFVSAAYPGMDVLVVGATALLLLTPGRRSPSFLLLAAGMVLYTACDVYYARALLEGSYSDGSWLDVGWMLGALCWGAAALHPSMRTVAVAGQAREVTLSRRRMAFLAAAALAVPSMRVLGSARDDVADVVVDITASGVIFLLVILRLSGLVHAVARGHRYHRALAEHGADLMAILGPDGTIGYASPSFAGVLGYDEQDLVGRDGFTLIDPADETEMRGALGNLLAHPGGKATLEVRARHADGTRRTLEAIATNLIDDPDVNGVVINARDVTARKQTDEALRSAEKQYRLLVERVPAVIYTQSTGPGAPTVYANAYTQRITGYAADEWLADPELWSKLLHPDDRERVEEADRIADETGAPYHEEYRMIARDGRIVWVREDALLIDGEDGQPDYWQGISVDMTPQKEAEAALRAREEEFRLLFSANPHPMAVYDRETLRFLEVNTATVDHYGYSRDEFLAMTVWDIYPVEEHAHLRTFFAQERMAEHQEVWKHQLSNGRLIDVEVTSHALTFRDRPAVLVVAQDVTERLALQAQLAHQAFHDPLTGLPNRALFLDRLSHALQRRTARPDSIAALFLDLDDFKIVNDTLGHEAGDDLLMAVAERLRGCIRPADTVARLGGDEFTILLEELDGIESARAVADRVSVALGSPVTVAGREIFVTSSIGIAMPATMEERAEDLLRAADAAMYEAKQKGKARYALFDPRMEAKAWARLRLEADLRKAIAEGQLRVYYQPLVDLATDRITEVEALVRWEHPARGKIAPSEFIPVAEETGLIIVLGQWVLEHACRQVRAWQRSSPALAELVVAVNLSVRQFQHPGLFADVARILDETGLAPGCLKLEITESAAIADAETAMATLQSLRDFGVHLAIDDFGTGYAGLSYLRTCPVDALKIDRSFIAGMGQEEEDVAMIRAVLGLAKTLGLAVTAEGIETQEQLDQLRDMGCAHGQGYLFAQPQPAEVMAKVLLGEKCDGRATDVLDGERVTTAVA